MLPQSLECVSNCYQCREYWPRMSVVGGQIKSRKFQRIVKIPRLFPSAHPVIYQKATEAATCSVSVFHLGLESLVTNS